MQQIKFFSKEDKERIIEFNKIVHDEGVVSTVNNIMFNNPFHSLQNFVYLEEDGKILSMVGLLIHKQRFGENEVEVGEIALVGTHPDYRKKGLCSRLMNYWEDYMKDRRIPLSCLIGIPKFYQQFGYEYAVPAHFYPYVTIDKELLKNINGCMLIEEVKVDEELLPEQEEIIDQIKAIYDKGSKDNFCSDLRSIEYFKYRIKATSFGPHHWYIVKNNEKVIGYFWVTQDDNGFMIREGNILEEEAGKSFCGFIYEHTKDKEKIINIRVKSPLNNSFSRYLYKRGGRFNCINEIYPGSWAGMYKIVDLKAAMEMLKDSFEERLKESRFYNYKGQYRIVTDIGEVVLLIDNSKIQICEEAENAINVNIPLNILTSIFTGYRDINYYKDELSFHSEEGLQLFKVLFPLGNPYFWDLEMSDELE